MVSRRFRALSLIVIFSMACWSSKTSIEEQSLDGVWKCVKVKDKDGVRDKVNPALFVSAGGYYSVTWHNDTGDRKEFEDRLFPTLEEKATAYSEVWFSSGTYEIQDSIVRMTAMIASNPYNMKGESTEVTIKFLDKNTFELSGPRWAQTWKRVE